MGSRQPTGDYSLVRLAPEKAPVARSRQRDQIEGARNDLQTPRRPQWVTSLNTCTVKKLLAGQKLSRNLRLRALTTGPRQMQSRGEDPASEDTPKRLSTSSSTGGKSFRSGHSPTTAPRHWRDCSSPAGDDVDLRCHGLECFRFPNAIAHLEELGISDLSASSATRETHLSARLVHLGLAAR